MKKLSILLLTWAISIDGYPQIRVFPIDSWHSEIRFTTKFGGLVDVSGRFKEFDGCIIFNENNLLALSASVRIETKTIDTGVEMRDEDLRGKKFFDVVSFPLITFSSKSTFKKDGNYFLVGDLEIHGVNRPIEIAVEQAHGIKKDPWSNDRITFTGTAKLNRKDFNVGLESKSISDEIIIDLVISARVLGMETIGMFKRPFGERMWKVVTEMGVDIAKGEYQKLKAEGNEDAMKTNSLYFIGLKLEQNNKPKEALMMWEFMVQVFDEASEVHSNLAAAYAERGMNNEAMREAQKSLHIDNKNTMALEIVKYVQQVK